MEDTKYIYKKVDNNALTNNQHILLKEPIFGLSNNNDPAKDAFYNNISHELRTPLNVVLGSIQLLR